MATYSYECTSCRTEFEEICKPTESDLALKSKCPSCGRKGNISQIFQINLVGSVGSGRNITGALREKLQALDSAYSKSSIRDSVNID